MPEFDDLKQNQKLEELRKREEEDLAQLLSERYGIPYVDLTNTTIDTNALRLIPEENAKSAMIASFGILNKKLNVAIQSPNREDTLNEIKDLERRGYSITPYLVSTKSLRHAWDRYKDISFATESKAGSLDVASEQIENFIKEVQSIEKARELIDETIQMKKSFKISRIVEVVVAAGVAVKASDIHIEPEENKVRVRFRLDGVLTDVADLDLETYKLLLSRIKLLSGLKLNIKNSAQDGRFSVKIAKTEYEIRTSVLPGNNGESIVMRLLDPNSITVSVSSLGIPEKLLNVLMKEISKPNGMILNTGPTGSGKTTALYSFLNKKKNPGVKIITIEDPIEYHLEGIVQTQVDKKKDYDFATGLRSSLRQDPDVIMVGEIRDKETAETAIHAALTGHLVFSTLHTNNAAGAFTRLIDLGINPKILTSAINVAIAQRLVRKLCPDCKKKVQLEGGDLNSIKNIYNEIKDSDKPAFSGEVFEAVGCEKCNGTGYKGRIGIFEAIISNEKVEKIIQENPSEREIMKAAADQGILTMPQDGIIKVIQGTTTLEEIQRVVDLEEGVAVKTYFE